MKKNPFATSLVFNVCIFSSGVRCVFAMFNPILFIVYEVYKVIVVVVFMVKVKCPKCPHEWDTKSQLINVSCPSCNGKVKVEENKVEGEKHGN